MREREGEFPFFISYVCVCVSYDCYYLKRERERRGEKREILRLIVGIEPSRRQELLLLIDSKSMKNERRVYRTEKERREGEWLIDWNNTSRYKGGKKGLWPWIITFWSSEQASMFGSNIILTSKMLTLMLGHRSSLTRALPFWYSRTSQVIDPYGRGVYILRRFWTVPHRDRHGRICIIIISENLSDVQSFESVFWRTWALARNFNCPSHHISFVWYWTTFRFASWEERRVNVEEASALAFGKIDNNR